MLFLLTVEDDFRQCTPTILEFKGFDAQKDVDALHKALEKNVDEKTIADIISNRNCGQRMEISRAYVNSFNKVSRKNPVRVPLYNRSLALIINRSILDSIY